VSTSKISSISPVQVPSPLPARQSARLEFDTFPAFRGDFTETLNP
jgi:hypothetical protein